MATTSILVLLFPAVLWAQVQGEISFASDTLHLEFSGQEQWVYELKPQKSGQVTISLPALSPKTKKDFESFKSPLIHSIRVDKGPDGGSLVLVKFTKDEDLEVFDYLTDQPSRLIVDFFPKEKKQEAPVSKVSQKKLKKDTVASLPPKALPKKGNLQKEEASRKPANDIVLVPSSQSPLVASVPESPTTEQKGIFDGGDPGFERFDIKDYEIKNEAIIASRENVYLDFPMLRMDQSLLSKIQASKPIYQIQPKSTDENKQARLLIRLYEKKRYSVFKKTLNWFREKYPKSEYDEIIDFLAADAFFAEWLETKDVNLFDMAMVKYREALKSHPESPLAERTLMLMGFASLDRGDYLGTLRQFQAHIQSRPDSPNKDISHLAIADAFLRLSQFSEAKKQYEQLMRSASEEKYKITASFLSGDVYFKKKDFKQAIKSYQEAISKYPDKISDFPNVFYNQAAALFGEGEYQKSLTSYREFLKHFPSHPFAGYAMTRVGELLEILGADATKVVGAYLETSFRYGNSESSVVAKLRLLSTRMNAMKPKEVEKAVSEIYELAKQTSLPKIEQFANLMIAEGYSRRNEYDKAIQLLVQFYQDHPTSADTELLKNRIVKNINEQLGHAIEHGDFISALQIHNKYADNWLKNSNRIDTKVMVGRAYELAGVYERASELYKDSLNKIMALSGTKSGQERNIFERLPSTDELNLRLAVTDWTQGRYQTAYQYLKDIKDPQKLSEKLQVERIKISASLFEKRGDINSAIRYLTELLKEWSGSPGLVAGPYLQLGQLEEKKKLFEEAILSYEKVDQLMKDSGDVDPAIHAQALQSLGELLLKHNRREEGQKVLATLLDLYEAKQPLSSVRYELGKTYFQDGEIQKAAEIWGSLKKDEKSNFWYQMAQEQLTNSEWSEEYKKYIQRIPAMSEKN